MVGVEIELIVCVLPLGDAVQYEGATARTRARTVDVICNGDPGAYIGKCSEYDRHLEHRRYDGDRRDRSSGRDHEREWTK